MSRRLTISKESHAQIAEAASRGVRATLIGIGISALLAAAKIISGIAGYSYALIADGVESMLDMVSALVVLGTLRIAATPPNENYPFGYGRVEPIGAIVVASGLLIAALGIAIQSVREILVPHHAPASWTLIILVVVVAAKELMFRFLNKTGAEIESSAIQTDAWHHRSDAITSAAAFVGISIALVGGEGYEMADDWAALFACAVIARNGFKLLRNALRDVMDAAPSPKLRERIYKIVQDVPGVEEVDKCLVRKSGLGYFVDLHIEVDGRIPVRDGHEISHRVKDALLASKLAIIDVSLHVEPWPNPYK
jgi:cation diffusion facilitator family transporter